MLKSMFDSLPDWSEFDREHEEHSQGGYVVSDDKSSILYSCGAVRGNPFGLGQTCEIPHYVQGPLLLDSLMVKHTRIVKFWELKLERAIEAFDDLKERLSNVVPSHDDAEDAALAHLRTLQAQVRQFKKELKKAEEARNKIDPTYVTPEQAQAQAQYEQEQNEKIEKFTRKVSKIKI